MQKFDRNAYTNLGPFFKLCIPTGAIVFFTLLGKQIITIYAGFLSVEELAAQSILVNISLLNYSLILGLLSSTSISIGKAIGAYDITLSKSIAKISYIFGFI